MLESCKTHAWFKQRRRPPDPAVAPVKAAALKQGPPGPQAASMNMNYPTEHGSNARNPKDYVLDVVTFSPFPAKNVGVYYNKTQDFIVICSLPP